jgi:uncharacterized repeat protein (TIGR04076 family)
MERREFIEKSGCGMLGLFAGSAAFGAEQAANPAPAQTPPAPRRKPYRIDLEIFEARTDSWCHKKGDKFAYPQDFSKICPWLQTCLHDFILVLDNGVTLPWKYEGTPYEKVIDPNGVTTEYVRCPDPTANLVVKITRTKT